MTTTIDTTEELSLKWGSLKGWKFNEGSPAHELAKQYLEEPVSMSAMAQRDTDRQKQLILEIIDAVNADKIYLDWDGVYVSKDKAKEYILNYGKDS